MYPIFQEKSIENDLRFISEAFKSCSSSRSQSISLEKLDMCHVCFFLNMTYPHVGLGLVDVVDVEEHYFEASEISDTILNLFLLKN